MIRKSIFEEDYKPQFSGHETFPIRYGWLEKAFHAVDEDENANPKIFSEPSAIAHFGVGKNMVAAIRFWAQVADIIITESKEAKSTDLGKQLFSKGGLDPFLENPTSLWRLHWEIASNPKHTSVYWLFNHLNEGTFDKDLLVHRMIEFAGVRNWKKPAIKTVSTDFNVLLSNYVADTNSRGPLDERLVSPFTELALIRARSNGKYSLNWGQKSSLTDGVFLYAVCDFWNRFTEANTLNFQTLLLEAGSPGRVFLLEESELAFRLMDVSRQTGGLISWSETAGLKQLIRTDKFESSFADKIFQSDYEKPQHKGVQ